MTPAPPHPCCIPSNDRLVKLHGSIVSSLDRPKANSGSLENMVRLDGGVFWMGSESADAFPGDGEGPVSQVVLSPFYISRYPVTNEQFGEFVRRTAYRTDAERFGWSFVFRNHQKDCLGYPAAETPWWLRIEKAIWSRPEGPDSSIAKRPGHPVVHVSWNDAVAYCAWAGFRLPTEAEWEYASRGGLDRKIFPWGDELTPGGRHMCNVWQGTFPDVDLGEDGFTGVAPVDRFEPNGYGLYNAIGNTWEWCVDYFDTNWHVDTTRRNPVGPPSGTSRILKGGSFLCHESYCKRYRCAARIGNTPDTSTGHIGFRVARDIGIQ